MAQSRTKAGGPTRGRLRKKGMGFGSGKNVVRRPKKAGKKRSS